MAVRLDDERLVVVVPLDAEATRKALAPCTLLSHRTVSGARNHVGERLEGLESIDGCESRADDDVFVREGHQRAVVGLGHQTLQHRITLGGSLHAHHSEEDARGPSNAFERREGEPVQLAGDARAREEHPIFLGLGDRTDVECATHVGQFVEVGVGERSAVAGLNHHGHRPLFCQQNSLFRRASSGSSAIRCRRPHRTSHESAR